MLGEDQSTPSSPPSIVRIHYGCEREVPLELPLALDDGPSRSTTTIRKSRKSFNDYAQSLTDGYYKWLDNLQQFYPHEDEGSSSLLMLYHVALIVISTELSDEQIVYDDYTYHFCEIVRLAKVYNSHKSQNDLFILGLGSIAPLYYTATYCRVPSLRREALQTLKSGPRRENAFGAKSVAELAGRLIAIEEEDLGLPPPWDDANGLSVDDSMLPAEEDRIHSHEILINRAAGRFELRVTRFRLDLDNHRVQTIQEYPI
jgi:hypothetical protein